MTIRKVIELIDTIKNLIEGGKFKNKITDYHSTIKGNPNNIVLLKEILDRVIMDFNYLTENQVPELLEKVLVGKGVPFTDLDDFQIQLENLKHNEHSNPQLIYNELHNIFTQITKKVNENLKELNGLKATFQPFLSRDFAELQKEDNAIFAIIFTNKGSYKDLKALSFELKNWNRGLYLYQQIISKKTPKAFDIIQVDEGSVEVVINLLCEVGIHLLDVFKVGIECYSAYLAYKTIVQASLVKTYNGNEELIKSEELREKLLLENVEKSVKATIKKQSLKKEQQQEALEKKLDTVTKLITEHIIKGNNVKLLSAPKEEEDTIYEKEDEKEKIFIKSQKEFKKLDSETKQFLISEFTTSPPDENFE